ncbi:MAG: hypothetical protein NTW11_00540 [Candidatus Staskawiczbacteria bacterium]|nr:hypothetical protein [Candidatus Staskawiczbacteria bacterium]
MNGLIHTLVLRMDPNLETGLFYALVTRYPGIARLLGITSGRIAVKFISTAEAGLRDSNLVNPVIGQEILKQLQIREDEAAGVAHFNVGGQGFRGWDNHGRPDGDKICSLMVALEQANGDVLEHRQHLQDLVGAVMQNDVTGRRISRHPFNLRELVTSLGALYPTDPMSCLEWIALAFYGLFHQAKASVKFEDLFSPEIIETGAKEFLKGCVGRNIPPFKNLTETEAKQKWTWFCDLMAEAIENSKEAWTAAQAAIESAEKLNKRRRVQINSLAQTVSVIELITDSYKAPAAARKAGYNLIIHHNRDGHVQIHSGIIPCADGRKRAIHMGEIAGELRSAESWHQRKAIRQCQNLTGVGFTYFEDNSIIPWYFPHFATSVFNGTRSSRAVPRTSTPRSVIFEIVCKTAPRCSTIDRE